MVKGSCLCGAIEYQVTLYPEKIFNCHCQFCRKAHGADYVTLAIADGDSLLLKDPQQKLVEHKNRLGGVRAFCGACGTRLMNYAPDKRLYLSVTMSTVDSDHAYVPVANANTESKAAWCQLNNDIVSYQGFPDGVLP